MVKPQKTDKTASPVKRKSNRCSKRPSVQKCRCEPTDPPLPSMSSLCKSGRTEWRRSLTRQRLSNEPRTKTQEKAHERRRCSQENAHEKRRSSQGNGHERTRSSPENANGGRRCCQENANERRRRCPYNAPETRTRARKDVYDASKRSQENEYERHPTAQSHPVEQHTRAQENAYDRCSRAQKRPYEPRTKGVKNQYEQSTREQDNAQETRTSSQENVYESRTSAQEDEDEKLTRVQELAYDPSSRTQEKTYEPRSTAKGNTYEPCIALVEKASFYLALLDELNSETFSSESLSYAAQRNGPHDPMDPSSASVEIIEAFNELSRILCKRKSTPMRKCTCDSKKTTEERFSRKSGEKQRRASGSIESLKPVESASSCNQDMKNSSTQTLTWVTAYGVEIEKYDKVPVIIIQDGRLEFKLQDLSNSDTESLSPTKDRKERKLNVSLTCEEFMTLMGVMRREINREAEKCRRSKDKSKVRNCTCSNQKSSQINKKIEKQLLDNSSSPALSELSTEDQEQQTGAKTTVILEPRQKPNGMLQAESSHSMVDLLGQLRYTDKPAPMEQKVAQLTERRRTPCHVDVQDFCKPHNQRKAHALSNVMTERNIAQEDAGKIVDFWQLLARLTQHKVYEGRPLPASLRPSRSRSCEKREFFADPAMLAAKRSELCWARYKAETSPCPKLYDAALKARQASNAQRYKLINVTEQAQRPADHRNKLFITPRRANHQNVNNLPCMTEQRCRPGNWNPVHYQDSYNSVNGVPMQMTTMFHMQNSMTYAQWPYKY